ncbi:lysosomal alpha-glucosidase-like [Macrosteles quadrilineatus]|uniref:lysosomal alpha-glucosidase-like n=1 Tax=Macrosteles quadrilineatus TaxID=74068 RepID=UPI0023E1FD2B|nr:lysosomal alpha-glucosidase-like [Macrosteles quadrilineatus]
MVKIDTILIAPAHKNKLGNRSFEQDKSTAKLTHKKETDKRYKIVDSPNLTRCDRCLLSIIKVAVKYPVISTITLIIVTFIFILALFQNAKCVLSSNDDTNCFIGNNMDIFNLNIKATQYQKNKMFISHNQCKNISDSDKFDCLPISKHSWTDEFQCYKKGCCWSVPKNRSSIIPHCYYPSAFQSYKFINDSTSDMGASAYFGLVFNSSYPNNVPVIRIDFNYRTEDILEVKIYDPTFSRYETPFPELPPMRKKPPKNTKYSVEIDNNKFGFRVVRKSNNVTIFNTQDVGGFIFADQLLQISAKLPSKYLYGLGQQRNNFLLDMNWTKITLFNHDQPPVDGSNLYGSHPFYLTMEGEGMSSGVLLLNSNAMDIVLSPAPAITYRTIGGVLDFFFFLGSSPAEVIQQYTELVGRPALPPYWSLGFHLCRFGYKTLDETIEVWNRTRKARIPFDTQWNDLDYMENGNDFTYDKTTFKGLPEFVDTLHKEGMHYVVLVDPGVSAGELPGEYPPYDDGIAQAAFVTDSSGYRPLVGKVWNKKSTVFVDFFKPEVVNYWMQQLRSLHDLVPFDGAWIDMNDPSNFVNGAFTGCGNSTLDTPPYVPGVVGGQLCYRTLCMSATHRGGSLSHYDVHNVYGLAEAIVTSFSMQQIRGKRPFVISRSSFPGQGRYSGVWTGDVHSTWDDMAHSVSDVLSFSLFGVPMSGADICGFNGNATVALCQRWSQLGAFYTFSRNHNSDLSSDQDPVALGPVVVESARKSLLVRYTLLPYLYTLFWHAHTCGHTVARPMFVEFPEDNKTYALNAQFLWGPALLIVPVLKENATEVEAYLPAGRWYDAYTCKSMSVGSGMTVTLPAPLDTIPLLLRGGYVIPTQLPDLTTTTSRSNPVDLLIALNEKDEAQGDLYWDDGDSLDYNDGMYNYLKFRTGVGRLHVEVVQWRYTNTTLILGKVQVLGVRGPVTQVYADNITVPFVYHDDVKLLQISHLYLDLSKNIEMAWK